jgi:hypothetical protein
MAGLGIWFWNNPRSFGGPNTCAVETASTYILGNPIPLRSGELRIWSIAMYSLFLVPGLNLILPMGLFFGMFIAYHVWRSPEDHSSSESDPCPSPTGIIHSTQSNSSLGLAFLQCPAWYDRLPAYPSIVPILVGLAILLGLNIIFLIDIELTIGQKGSGDESSWTFGQILAVLLLVLPFRDLLVAMRARSEKARMKEEKKLKDKLAGNEKEYRGALSLS